MGAVTMKSIAQKMGVSVTTVSNAYNYPDRLSADLRTKILAAGDDLGYCGPDAAGRLLRSGRAMAVGVLCGAGYSYAFDDEYTLAMFRGLSRELERNGVALQLLATGADEQNIDSIARAVVDAIVCFTQRTDTAPVLFARKRGVPVIHTHLVPNASYVAIDDRAAGHQMGEHIASLGHRRVAMVAQSHYTDTVSVRPIDHSARIDPRTAPEGSFWDERARGIVEALPGAEIVMAVVPKFGSTDVAAVTEQLLGEFGATALVALSDRVALLLLDEVLSRGLTPGRDVSISGFDGVPEALNRGLTTVSQPTEEKGHQVARLALDPLLEPRRVLLPTELVVGTTTGPAPTL